MRKVKVRLLKDIEFAGKAFLKNTMVEVNLDFRLYNDHGGSRLLDISEACVIDGRELFTKDDLYAVWDWATDPYLSDRKEYEHKIAILEQQVRKLTDINSVLEEKLYESRKQ